jgi:hypothetical protein
MGKKGEVSLPVYLRTISPSEGRKALLSGLAECLGERDVQNSGPSTPLAAKRSCHRHTHGLDLPVGGMIAIVPRPQWPG